MSLTRDATKCGRFYVGNVLVASATVCPFARERRRDRAVFDAVAEAGGVVSPPVPGEAAGPPERHAAVVPVAASSTLGGDARSGPHPRQDDSSAQLARGHFYLGCKRNTRAVQQE